MKDRAKKALIDSAIAAGIFIPFVGVFVWMLLA